MNAQKLQSSVECAGQLELLMKDCNHEVCTDGDPYLGLHRIGTGSVVVLDAQVTLDPAEEQFDAPAKLVKHGNGERWNFEVVGQEDEFLACFQIDVFHPAQEHWKGPAGFFESGFSDMVAAQAGESIHHLRVMPRELKVGLGACDEERSSLGDQPQADEVHVAAIHQIEGARFEEQAVEPAHVVLARPGDVDASGDGTTQVDLGVHLDTCLGLPEVGPWKEGEGQIDGGRVQSIDRIVQIESEILAGIERSCRAHQTLGEVFPNPPVPVFVGIGERRFGKRLAEPKMVERFGSCVETSSNIAQTFPRGHLGEDHADELLSKSEMTYRGCEFVTLYNAVESLAVNQVENLREDEAAGVHGREFWKIPLPSSNPSHPFLFVTNAF